MIIYDKINECIQHAMLDKDKELCEIYRSIKCAFQTHETSKGAKPIDEEIEINILKKLSKQALESSEIFLRENRHDLYAKRHHEYEVISNLLPDEPTDEELKSFISDVIYHIDSPTMRDMGNIMRMTKERYPSADGKKISTIASAIIRILMSGKSE